MQTTNNFIYVAEKLGRVKYIPMYSANTYERAEQTLEVLQQIYKEKCFIIVCTSKKYNTIPSERVRLFDFA